MRRLLAVGLFVCLAITLVFVLGPREPFSGVVDVSPDDVGDDLDLHLMQSEDQISDIRPGAQKQIIWHDPASKNKTEFAFVYIHGYTASLGEIRPVPDEIARSNGANLFYTRLTGHGRTPEAMAEARADDWVNDVAEAIAIGSRLGNKVIVIGTSTGGAVTTWLLANKPEWRERVAGLVLISPNFKIADPNGFFLTWPWARQLVPLVIGPMRGKASSSGAINQIWTEPHATTSLMPMAKITSEAAASPVERIDRPAFFIFSPKDKVVVPSAIKDIAGKWGGDVDELIFDESGHENHHVILGDAISPQNNQAAISAINSWIDRSF